MTAKNQNVIMTSGDTMVITVTVTDSGSAKDITGATIKYQAAKNVKASEDISKQTGGSGITITDAGGGVFQITLDPADTASLSGVYYHEAEVTDASSNVSTVLRGKLIIDEDLI